MDNATPLSNTMYDILKVMGKDAEFLYYTIDKYTDDAEKENKKELANTWRKIKSDRLNHINLLKEALEKVIHGG
jgi:rubrerythrin